MGNNYTKLSDNESALFYAINKGQMHMVVSLIELGVNVNIQNSSGDAPLLCACVSRSSNNVDIIATLLANKANPNIKNCINNTPLCYALNYGRRDIVTTLLQNNANPNIGNIDGHTPLHLAVMNGVYSVSILLQNKANPNTVDREGQTPLGRAIYWNKKDVVIELLRYNADSNVINRKKMSALQYAMSENRLDIITELLKHKQNNNNVVSENIKEIPQNIIVKDIKPPCDRILCPICMTNDRNTVFNCGHSTCSDCANKISECGECRGVILIKKPLYI